MSGLTGPGAFDAFVGVRTEVDYLLVADYAEVVNGKTYLMGAGWDTITPGEYPTVLRFAIAIGLRVPHHQAGAKHHLTLVIRAAGNELARMEADVETTRSADPTGDSTLVPIAINHQLQLVEPTTLELEASVDGRAGRKVTIRAARRT